MTFETSIDYIQGLDPFGMQLGLKRIKTLLTYLGNPQEQISCIHIAGTNGKGSVSQMINSVLLEAGYKVGIFNSPHLQSYKEYYKINNNLISDEGFCNLTSHVKKAANDMVKDGHPHPTKFEFITAMMYLYFAQEKVDYAIIEVGLGGREDSTNVISKPLVSVITTIDFDHTGILGDTLEAIAGEKAGIIKEGCPVVTHNTNADVLGVLSCRAKVMNAPFYETQLEDYIIIDEDSKHTVIKGLGQEYKIGLPGHVQVKNAILALKVLDVLEDQGVVINHDQKANGLAYIPYEGRIEHRAYGKKSIIFDGCHNETSVSNLVSYMKKYYKGESVIVLLGMLKDKDYKAHLSRLADLGRHIIFTEIPNNPRSLTVEEIKVELQQESHYSYIQSLDKALELSLDQVKEGESLLVAGSLYLVGAVKGKLSDSGKEE